MESRNLSLMTAFAPVQTLRRTSSPSSTSSLRSASSSTMNSTPSSSPRPPRRTGVSSSPSRSIRPAYPSTSRFVLHRIPSSVDLAVSAEAYSASHIEHVGLSLMEPRPVSMLPVSVIGASDMWDNQSQRSSWFSTASSFDEEVEDRKRRSEVMGNDSPVDYIEGMDGMGIEGRLFGPVIGGVERGSFVMDSIFEVMKRH